MASDFCGAICRPFSRIQLLTMTKTGFINSDANGPMRVVPMTATSSAKATSWTPCGIAISSSSL